MPGSADRLKRIRMIKKYYTDNLAEQVNTVGMGIDTIKEKLNDFYKSQGRTISNFKRTSNTRREDIQAALEELEVLAI
jgi:Sec-independent protein translocase protein TatA